MYCGMVPLIDPDQIRFDPGMVKDGGDFGGKPDFVTEFQYLDPTQSWQAAR